MTWHQRVEAILAQEPELWLDYLTGMRLAGDLPKSTSKSIKLPTFALKSLWFFLWATTKWSRHAKSTTATPGKNSEFIFLATSRNQINTTSGIIRALADKGHSVRGVSKRKRLKTAESQSLYVPIAYSAKDIARALTAYKAHGHALFRQLRNSDQDCAENQFLEVAKVYLYLAYFYRILEESDPRFVVTSNDHSALNRCMLAVAHLFDIKTVYVQHASVSPHFPALLFDYAFLDGPAAAEIYARCSQNRPDTLNRHLTSNIIYSGQQKTLTKRPSEKNNTVGIAINKMDDISSVLRIIRLLMDKGVDVITRWHPRQSKGDVHKLEGQARKHARMMLSNPEQETVDEFLGQVGWLIAGNSSIHLEGAIKGVAPLYYEFSATSDPDYYGFVEKGLATRVRSESDLFAILTSDHAPELNKDAVRFYSSTFGTEWEGRENELVASYLSKLLGHDTP